MPKDLEMKLAREADRKGLTGRRKQAYIYATLQRVEQEKQRKRATPKRKKR